MLRQFPFLPRFYSKLVYELLPGAIISAVGGILLNQYYVRPPVAVTVAAPASAELMHAEQTRLIGTLAKTGEEVRPRIEAVAQQDSTEPKPAEPAAASRTAKPAETKAAPRAEKSEKRIASKPQRQAPAGQPLQLTQTPSNTPAQPAVQPMPAPPVTAQRDDNVIVAKLRDVTTTVRQIPARVRSAVTWSFDDFPPRPPAPVIGQNFLKASL